MKYLVHWRLEGDFPITAESEKEAEDRATELLMSVVLPKSIDNFGYEIDDAVVVDWTDK